MLKYKSFAGPLLRAALGCTGLGGERKGRRGCRGLARTAEGLSAEPDLVGALKVVDEAAFDHPAWPTSIV